jgi:DNA polymerase-1
MKIGPLVLIDGHNTFIRSYVRSPYMDRDGQRAGGTVGMIASVRKIINDFRPSNALVVWDGEGGSQRRRTIYSSYKEGRKVRLNEEYDFNETPEQRMENMQRQRQHASDLLTLLGVPQVRADAVEADDLIAYIAGKMENPNGVIIVSTDQDFLQLIRGYAQPDPEIECYTFANEGKHDIVDGVFCCCGQATRSEVRVYSPIRKVMYDREKFISEYGVLPENFRFVKSLMGDASDNIAGIKGFGIKLAPRTFPVLTERSTTVGELLQLAEGVEGVLGKRLLEEKSRFLENLRLMDLSDPMLSATAARQARDALVRDVGCKELEFRMRVVRDGISFSGNDFTGPFRELVLRRRKWLNSNPPSEEDIASAMAQTIADEVDNQILEEVVQKLQGAEDGS